LSSSASGIGTDLALPFFELSRKSPLHPPQSRSVPICRPVSTDVCAPPTSTPQSQQETLGEMVGTTCSRVNFFMNRFRKLGFIGYNGRIRVHRPLLKVVLHDRMPYDNVVKLGVPDAPRDRSISAKTGHSGQKMTSNAIGLASSSLEDALGVQRPILDPLAPITDGRCLLL
jgi:hypothetical protein